MPSPTPMAVRQNIMRQYEEGLSVSLISRNFNVSRGTVHTLINRYASKGEPGLTPLYFNCGKKRPDEHDFIYRSVRCLKTWHPGWGGEKIHAEISRFRPKLKLPHVRTFYHWFGWNEQTLPSTKLPKEPRVWAKRLHEGWQLDLVPPLAIWLISLGIKSFGTAPGRHKTMQKSNAVKEYWPNGPNSKNVKTLSTCRPGYGKKLISTTISFPFADLETKRESKLFPAYRLQEKNGTPRILIFIGH